MKKQCTVYGLYSTADKQVRYVGQTTKRLDHRYQQHLNEARQPGRRTKLTQWIRAQWANGQGVLCKPLVKRATWNEDERRVIAEFAERGHWLVNTFAGGSWPDFADATTGIGVSVAYRQYRRVRRRKPGPKLTK